LRQAMARETELLFDHVVRTDRSVLELLTADYTFVNERLARHYGITGVAGPEFHKVALAGTRRGGVLTHASVLAATSNPTRPSPPRQGGEGGPGKPPGAPRRPRPPRGGTPGGRPRGPRAAARYGCAWSGTAATPPAPPATPRWIRSAWGWRTSMLSAPGALT